MTPDQCTALTELVLRLLEDSSIEVRNLACDALSGLVKMTDPAFRVKLERRFLATKRRATDSVTAQHGHVLGLAAMVRSFARYTSHLYTVVFVIDCCRSQNGPFSFLAFLVLCSALDIILFDSLDLKTVF